MRIELCDVGQRLFYQATAEEEAILEGNPIATWPSALRFFDVLKGKLIVLYEKGLSNCQAAQRIGIQYFSKDGT